MLRVFTYEVNLIEMGEHFQPVEPSTLGFSF